MTSATAIPPRASACSVRTRRRRRWSGRHPSPARRRPPPFGDRPRQPPVEGPRPALRFPLGSYDDPNSIEPPGPGPGAAAGRGPRAVALGRVGRRGGTQHEPPGSPPGTTTGRVRHRPRWREDRPAEPSRRSGHAPADGPLPWAPPPSGGGAGGWPDPPPPPPAPAAPLQGTPMTFEEGDDPPPGRSVFGAGGRRAAPTTPTPRTPTPRTTRRLRGGVRRRLRRRDLRGARGGLRPPPRAGHRRCGGPGRRAAGRRTATCAPPCWWRWSASRPWRWRCSRARAAGRDDRRRPGHLAT